MVVALSEVHGDVRRGMEWEGGGLTPGVRQPSGQAILLPPQPNSTLFDGLKACRRLLVSVGVLSCWCVPLAFQPLVSLAARVSGFL